MNQQNELFTKPKRVKKTLNWTKSNKIGKKIYKAELSCVNWLHETDPRLQEGWTSNHLQGRPFSL